MSVFGDSILYIDDCIFNVDSGGIVWRKKWQKPMRFVW